MLPFSESEKWIKKARDCYEDANILIDYNKQQGPISKMYYVAFSCAKALLVVHEVKAVKHASVIGLFGKVLVKEKGFHQKFGRFINEMFGKRKNADYSTSPAQLKREELKELLNISSEFIERTQAYVTKMRSRGEGTGRENVLGTQEAELIRA